jgi:hypothetical protein
MLGDCEQCKSESKTLTTRAKKKKNGEGRGKGKGKLHRLWEGDVDRILFMILTGDKELPG